MNALENDAHRFGRPRALLVEQSNVLGRVLRLLLEAEGYEVVMASSAQTARGEVAPLELMLVDAYPHEESVRRIGDLPWLRRVPLVLVWSSGMRLPRALRGRTMRVISKPFDLDELLDAIRGVTAARMRGEAGA